MLNIYVKMKINKFLLCNSFALAILSWCVATHAHASNERERVNGVLLVSEGQEWITFTDKKLQRRGLQGSSTIDFTGYLEGDNVIFGITPLSQKGMMIVKTGKKTPVRYALKEMVKDTNSALPYEYTNQKDKYFSEFAFWNIPGHVPTPEFKVGDNERVIESLLIHPPVHQVLDKNKMIFRQIILDTTNNTKYVRYMHWNFDEHTDKSRCLLEHGMDHQVHAGFNEKGNFQWYYKLVYDSENRCSISVAEDPNALEPKFSYKGAVTGTLTPSNHKDFVMRQKCNKQSLKYVEAINVQDPAKKIKPNKKLIDELESDIFNPRVTEENGKPVLKFNTHFMSRNKHTIHEDGTDKPLEKDPSLADIHEKFRKTIVELLTELTELRGISPLPSIDALINKIITSVNQIDPYKMFNSIAKNKYNVRKDLGELAHVIKTICNEGNEETKKQNYSQLANIIHLNAKVLSDALKDHLSAASERNEAEMDARARIYSFFEKILGLFSPQQTDQSKKEKILDFLSLDDLSVEAYQAKSVGIGIRFKLSNDSQTPGYFFKGDKEKRPEGSEDYTIIMVHGGPHAASFNELSEEGAFYQSLGYNILYVNVSGSTGFGSKISNEVRGNFACGARDVECIVKQLTSGEHHMYGNRFIVSGGSYGGLVAATVYKDLKCDSPIDVCIADAGAHDLNIVYDQCRKSGRDAQDDAHFIGINPQTRSENSATHDIKKVPENKQLLMTHGGADTTTPVECATKLFEAHEKEENNVIYLKFPDQGHGYNGLYTNRARYWKACNLAVITKYKAPVSGNCPHLLPDNQNYQYELKLPIRKRAEPHT
jgi:hypothetical protein